MAHLLPSPQLAGSDRATTQPSNPSRLSPSLSPSEDRSSSFHSTTEMATSPRMPGSGLSSPRLGRSHIPTHPINTAVSTSSAVRTPSPSPLPSPVSPTASGEGLSKRLSWNRHQSGQAGGLAVATQQNISPRLPSIGDEPAKQAVWSPSDEETTQVLRSPYLEGHDDYIEEWDLSAGLHSIPTVPPPHRPLHSAPPTAPASYAPDDPLSPWTTNPYRHKSLGDLPYSAQMSSDSMTSLEGSNAPIDDMELLTAPDSSAISAKHRRQPSKRVYDNHGLARPSAPRRLAS
ncbi:hypothetical protein M231_05094, partial [Tremella mesenterica]